MPKEIKEPAKPISDMNKEELRAEIVRLKTKDQEAISKIDTLQNDLNTANQKKESMFDEKLLLKKEFEMSERIYLKILKGLGYGKSE